MAPSFRALSLRYAWRSLRRAPVFTLTATLTLALGVGAVTAIFSVVNAVLLRALPFPEAERLVAVGHSASGINMGEVGQSLGTYFTYRRQGTAFESVGLWTMTSTSLAEPAGGTLPERLRTVRVTPSVLEVLRAVPMYGRAFSEAEGLQGASDVVILSEDFWRRRFGADRSIVGRTVQLDGARAEVVGIMPRAYSFPDARTQAWLPLRLDPSATEAGGFNYTGIARLAPGATMRAAQADAERTLARVPDFYPTLAPGMPMAGIMQSARLAAHVRPFIDDIIGPFARVLWVVAATAALVLLVACANLANLLLVRTEGRQRELTVRAALGAGRGRVLAHFVGESVVIAALGGALGVALAVAGVALLVRRGPDELPRLSEVSVDGTALAFGVLAALGAALLATVLPAWRQRRVNLAAMLRDGGRAGTAGPSRQRSRAVLVGAQVAMAMVLLAGSGLLVRSVMRLRDVRPGFDASRLLTFRLDLPYAKYRSSAEQVRFQRELDARLSALPGVQSVGVTSKLPLMVEGSNLNPFTREDRPLAPDQLPPLVTFVRSSSTYFRTMGIALVAGRTFSAGDEQSPFEVVVSRHLAAEQWGDSTGARALGQRLKSLNEGTYTVIGVVETVLDSSLAAPPVSQAYFPIVSAADTGKDRDLVSMSAVSVVVRTRGDPLALVPAVRRSVAELDPALPMYHVRPMDEVVSQSYARLTFTLAVLAVAAGAALLLGAVGLYGVIAYIVTLRSREIGVRIALGAQPGSVGRSVARQGVVLALGGAAAGLVLFLLTARTLRVFLYGIEPTDPVTLLAVTATLVTVAAAASWLPARRAARIDPVEAMRADVG